jgi:hypothetical protein
LRVWMFGQLCFASRFGPRGVSWNGRIGPRCLIERKKRGETKTICTAFRYLFIISYARLTTTVDSSDQPVRWRVGRSHVG